MQVNTTIKKTPFSKESWSPHFLQEGYSLFEIPRGGYLITTHSLYGYNFLVTEKNKIFQIILAILLVNTMKKMTSVLNTLKRK